MNYETEDDGMEQNKFGMIIKKIRKDNNLTQKDLAKKYNVTYQAISKWENGLNMPDISLLKRISEDFNISMEELLGGEKKSKKKSKLKYFLLSFLVIFIIVFCIIFINKISNFEFKTLSSTCDSFTISGNISYNNKKTSIYITNIRYCDKENTDTYKNIECILYEKNGDTNKKISSFNYDKEENITLENFLNQVTFTVDNYQKTCEKFTENSLYLLINATDVDGKITTFKVPLALESKCN